MKLAKTFVEVDVGSGEPAETTIKGYMPIGSVAGSGTVAVSAFEMVVPKREMVYHGARFEVKSDDEYSHEAIVTIDKENAERLIQSLDNLGNTKISTERFALSEVEIAVDDLRVVVFNTGQGRLRAAVSAGGTTCHLMKQSDLFDLSRRVSMAIVHLTSKGSLT